MSATRHATVIQIASVLLDFSAFALFQSGAKAQPLGNGAGSRGTVLRVAARLAALGLIAVGCMLLVPVMTTVAAILLTLIALAIDASVFVLLAAIRPRMAWRGAFAATAVAIVLVLCTRVLP